MELHLEDLEIKESAKHVLQDYFSGKFHTIAERYSAIADDIKNELTALEIYDWIEARLKDRKLDVFILYNKWYFDHIGEMDSSFLNIYDLSCTIFHPQIDIILLDPNVRLYPLQKKKSSLHEITHEYIFHNHPYLTGVAREESNPIKAFNKKIQGLEEISTLNEYAATVIPFLFPNIAPAYGDVEIEPKTKALIDKLSDKGEAPSKLLKLATHFKTLEELEKSLGITQV